MGAGIACAVAAGTVAGRLAGAGGPSAAAALREHAAEAALADADWAEAADQAGHARDLYRQCGDTRSAARVQATAGHALGRLGRNGEAREQLAAALAVLRADPDANTVRALDYLVALEISAGGVPAAEALSAEALALGQDLAVDDATLARLFTSRGICHVHAEHRQQAAACHREAAQLAEQAGDTVRQGIALLNLSDAVTGTYPAAGAEAARAAAARLCRVGARRQLATAIGNLAHALVMTGDWDTALGELTQAIDGDGLADIEHLSCCRAWLAALRGDTPAARTDLAALGGLRASQSPQDQARIAVAEAFTAAACGQPAVALRHARVALGQADALGISHENLRWAWPLAARAAHDLADVTATTGLLAQLDGHPPGHLAPMQRAERDLARARLAATDEAFAGAIAGLRRYSTPYHLAHGLLDHAAHLAGRGGTGAATVAIGEAVSIAERLGCRPLLDRAETIRERAARSPMTTASMGPALRDFRARERI
jgi:tetratricopeptide (TPR) repeat protein